MKKVIFKFGWQMTNYWARGSDPAGILFHKWAPHGEKDGISLLDHTNVKLNVWFDRRGFKNDSGMIQYSDKKMEELKDELIEKHGKLESGPLFLKLSYTIEITDEQKIIARDAEWKSGKCNNINDYEELGKNIYNLLYDKISVLVYTLKYKFGQYWIDDFPYWDSKDESLGHYFLMLQARYCIDDKFYKFVPNHPSATLTAKMSGEKEFLELITKDDWLSLQKKDFLNINSGLEYLAKSATSYYEKELRNAFIDACIALELILSKLFTKFQQENLQCFFDTPRKVQLCVIANLVLKDLSDTIISNACKAIDKRNDIIHRGYIPKSEDEKYYIDLIKVIKKLFGDTIKTPHKNLGQVLYHQSK